MSVNSGLRLSKYKSIYFMMVSVMIGLTPIDDARALTGGDVIGKMDATERHAYLAGMVEGLAYSRFLRDRPDEAGMKCVGNWYFQDRQKHQKRINAWFERHADKPASALLYVLIKKECGE